MAYRGGGRYEPDPIPPPPIPQPPSAPGGTSAPAPGSAPSTNPAGGPGGGSGFLSRYIQSLNQPSPTPTPSSGPTGNSPSTPYEPLTTAEGIPSTPAPAPPPAPTGSNPVHLGDPNAGLAMRSPAYFSHRYGTGTAPDLPDPISMSAGTPYTDPNKEDYLRRIVASRVGGI